MEIYHKIICGHEYFGIKYSENHLPLVIEVTEKKIALIELQYMYSYIQNNLI